MSISSYLWHVKDVEEVAQKKKCLWDIWYRNHNKLMIIKKYNVIKFFIDCF